jgi:DNA-directed RNA polymerase specialized sigma24 family protein
MTTDEQLVEEFQRGSRDAFAELFRRYRDKMYGFFRRRTANPARAGGYAGWACPSLYRQTARLSPKHCRCRVVFV